MGEGGVDGRALSIVVGVLLNGMLDWIGCGRSITSGWFSTHAYPIDLLLLLFYKSRRTRVRYSS